jgi:hypothetical protein
MKISASMCGLFDQYNLSITLDAHFSRVGKMWKSKDYVAFEHQAMTMTEQEYHCYTKTRLILTEKVPNNFYEAENMDVPEKFTEIVDNGWCDNLNGFISQKYILQHL